MSLHEWVKKAHGQTASDLLLEADTPAVIRVRGELQSSGETISASDLLRECRELLGADRWEDFAQRGSADLSTHLAGVRCRINLFRTTRGMAAAVRLLTTSIRSLAACNLHPDLRSLVEPESGLVVLSGPTGCGKSTTLAALVQEINASRARNIIAIESPIEHLFANSKSFIRQREVPTHSPSYEQAIIDALREDPDILIIGEMRTPEVMRLTLNAAETGHLVLTTMHSATCAEALYRICLSFAPDLQGGIRAQLADCLVGVICQHLEFLPHYGLLVPRCEVLRASSGSRGTIRAGQFSQIANVLQAGGDDGMWSSDRYRRWMQQKRDWVTAAPEAGERRSTLPDPPLRKREPAPASRETRDAFPVEFTIDEDTSLTELAKQADESVATTNPAGKL
ncbi:MAG TPA: ATPase, T2SS/T4P/T4SS family [Povalibacter sp.]